LNVAGEVGRRNCCRERGGEGGERGKRRGVEDMAAAAGARGLLLPLLFPAAIVAQALPFDSRNVIFRLPFAALLLPGHTAFN
jgi:hypothetical protein